MTHHKDRSFQIADLDRTWWETTTKGTEAVSPPKAASDNVQCYVFAAPLTRFSDADPPLTRVSIPTVILMLRAVTAVILVQ